MKKLELIKFIENNFTDDEEIMVSDGGDMCPTFYHNVRRVDFPGVSENAYLVGDYDGA